MRPFISGIVLENKRSATAHISARQSCLIDPELGAFNLFATDRILPAGAWVQINRVQPAYLTVEFSGDARDSQENLPAGASQRMLLRIEWDDGATESVDLAYEVALQT